VGTSGSWLGCFDPQVQMEALYSQKNDNAFRTYIDSTLTNFFSDRTKPYRIAQDRFDSTDTNPTLSSANCIFDFNPTISDGALHETAKHSKPWAHCKLVALHYRGEGRWDSGEVIYENGKLAGSLVDRDTQPDLPDVDVGVVSIYGEAIPEGCQADVFPNPAVVSQADECTKSRFRTLCWDSRGRECSLYVNRTQAEAAQKEEPTSS